MYVAPQRPALHAGRGVLRVYAVALLALALVATFIGVVEVRSARRAGRTAAAWHRERTRWHAVAAAQHASYARSLAALRVAQRTFRADAALLDAQRLAYRGALALAGRLTSSVPASVGGVPAGAAPGASVVSAASGPATTRTS